MLIVGGVNVFPKDIEEIVSKHDDVSEVAVFGIPNEKWGESVIAMVVPKPGINAEQIDKQELIKWTNARVGAKYQRLHGVWPMAANQVPRNIAGKVLKRTLRDNFPRNSSRPCDGKKKKKKPCDGGGTQSVRAGNTSSLRLQPTSPTPPLRPAALRVADPRCCRYTVVHGQMICDFTLYSWTSTIESKLRYMPAPPDSHARSTYIRHRAISGQRVVPRCAVRQYRYYGTRST